MGLTVCEIAKFRNKMKLFVVFGILVAIALSSWHASAEFVETSWSSSSVNGAPPTTIARNAVNGKTEYIVDGRSVSESEFNSLNGPSILNGNRLNRPVGDLQTAWWLVNV